MIRTIRNVYIILLLLIVYKIRGPYSSQSLHIFYKKRTQCIGLMYEGRTCERKNEDEAI